MGRKTAAAVGFRKYIRVRTQHDFRGRPVLLFGIFRGKTYVRIHTYTIWVRATSGGGVFGHLLWGQTRVIYASGRQRRRRRRFFFFQDNQKVHTPTRSAAVP